MTLSIKTQVEHCHQLEVFCFGHRRRGKKGRRERVFCPSLSSSNQLGAEFEQGRRSRNSRLGRHRAVGISGRADCSSQSSLSREQMKLVKSGGFATVEQNGTCTCLNECGLEAIRSSSTWPSRSRSILLLLLLFSFQAERKATFHPHGVAVLLRRLSRALTPRTVSPV